MVATPRPPYTAPRSFTGSTVLGPKAQGACSWL